jgi:UDP-glucose 4-epimerase
MDAASVPGPNAAGSAVVVTGGSGFIGSKLVADLRAAGFPVATVDREPYPDPERPGTVGDLRDEQIRGRSVTSGAPALVHLAAATSVIQSTLDPLGFLEDNVDVTAALLETARERGVHQFVLASTNAAAGDTGGAVIDEASPLRPLSAYGATKAAGEMLLSAYQASYGMTTCALRLTNVYGHGMHVKDSLVARLMRSALADRPQPIYGDGHQRRDFVHVTDVSAAFGLALRDRWTGTVVVGAGASISVLDLVERVRRITGRTIEVEHRPARRGEVHAVQVSIAHARALGFEPTVDLDDGLAALWDEARSGWPVPTP